jgi:hypothetical protein
VRRSSGTIGFSMIAWAASTAGTGGIEVRPAPRRAPRSRAEEPSRRVALLPEPFARADPSAVEASRSEARDTVEDVWAMPAGTVATDTPLDVAATDGGEPQTSQ